MFDIRDRYIQNVFRRRHCTNDSIYIGNPGLLDFYTPFLTAIHDKAGGELSILGHALIGHTTGIDLPNGDNSGASLTAQVEGLIEIVDAVKPHYEKLTVAGHSMGSWLTLQVTYPLLLFITKFSQ